VRGIGGELRHVGHGGLQPRQHLVERGRQTLQLGVGRRRVEPPLEAAHRDGLDVLSHPVDRDQRAARDPVPAGTGRDHDGRHQQYQRTESDEGRRNACSIGTATST
jgi:hypothetical protein